MFGPVSSIPYTDTDVYHLTVDYVIPQNKLPAFREFLKYGPELSLTAFLQKLLLVNYCVNQSEMSMKDLISYDKEEVFDNASLIKEYSVRDHNHT